MLTLLMALVGAPALADAQVSFHSDMPVRFYVDGARISSTANLKPVELSLAPGEHQIRVETMLGRTLHDEVIDVSDGEAVDTRWRFRDFEMRSTGGVAEAPRVADAAPEREPEVFEEPEVLAIPADAAPIDGEAAFEAAVPTEEEAAAVAAVAAVPAPEVDAEPEAEAAPEADTAPIAAVDPAPADPAPELAPAAGDGVASVDSGADGLILIGPAIAEEALGEAPAAPVAEATLDDAFVTGGIQLADGELHITITQGLDEGTRTLDIAVTRDGVHVFDSEGASYGSVALGAGAAPGAPEAGVEAEVVFVSRDGQWANLYIDGELAAYITNDGEASLSLTPGIHTVEIRDSRGRQTWHRGALTVTSGFDLEVGFARDLSPQVMGDREAWASQDPVGRR